MLPSVIFFYAGSAVCVGEQIDVFTLFMLVSFARLCVCIELLMFSLLAPGTRTL